LGTCDDCLGGRDCLLGFSQIVVVIAHGSSPRIDVDAWRYQHAAAIVVGVVSPSTFIGSALGGARGIDRHHVLRSLLLGWLLRRRS
jgi:hypothetical protein